MIKGGDLHRRGDFSLRLQVQRGREALAEQRKATDRTETALRELRNIVEGYPEGSAEREEKLVEFFRGPLGGVMGRDGDVMGWNPEQTAKYFLGD